LHKSREGEFILAGFGNDKMMPRWLDGGDAPTFAFFGVMSWARDHTSSKSAFRRWSVHHDRGDRQQLRRGFSIGWMDVLAATYRCTFVSAVGRTYAGTSSGVF